MNPHAWLQLAETSAFGRIDGVITILAGLYILGLYHGVIPFKSRKGLTYEEWKEKHGTVLLICAWALIGVSLLRLVGILTW